MADLTARIEAVLEELRPFLRSDGGDVRLVGVDAATGIVRVHLVGACGTCPSATQTLEHGIKVRLQEAVPEVTQLLSVGAATRSDP